MFRRMKLLGMVFVCVLSLVGGCAFETEVLQRDATFCTSFPGAGEVGVARWDYIHRGSSAWRFVLGVFYFPIEGESAAALEIACREAVEEVLRDELGRAYVLWSELDYEPKDFRTQDTLGKANAEHDLDAIMVPTIEFNVSTGFSKRLVVCSRWKVYDQTGRLVFDGRNGQATKNGEGLFPSTFDEHHREAFVELARRSARDFLRQLGGRGAAEAVHSILTYHRHQ